MSPSLRSFARTPLRLHLAELEWSTAAVSSSRKQSALDFLKMNNIP
eukprot:COSAG03_NODE_2310_length_2895_cov_2.896638_3_plen_46_part_00